MGSPLQDEKVAQSKAAMHILHTFTKKKNPKHPALGPSATARQSSISPEGRRGGATRRHGVGRPSHQMVPGRRSPAGADGPKQQRGMARKAAERLGSALGSGSSHTQRWGEAATAAGTGRGKNLPDGSPERGWGQQEGKRLSWGYGGSLQAEHLNWAYKHPTIPSMVLNSVTLPENGWLEKVIVQSIQEFTLYWSVNIY